MAATHVQSIDTVLFADAVAWNHGDLLACGTYQLHEESGVRKGSVLLYLLEENQNVNGVKNLHLRECFKPSLDGSGVLDMKWMCDKETVLITARANGCVQLLRFAPCSEMLSAETASLSSNIVHTVSLDSLDNKPRENTTLVRSDLICLSVDHSHGSVITSDNKGQLTLLKIENKDLNVVKKWQGHSQEAWIAAFGHDTNTVLSGGDDCRLCMWDVRCDPCACVASKRHDMGVVSIQAHPVKPWVFASGSYNEVLSLWDQRNLRSPLQELPVGGGVWRIKWNLSNSDLVALACMHGGCKIVDVNRNEVVCRYVGHQSLAYGIDWYQGGLKTSPNTGTGLLASCSFYDHSLQMWTF